MPTSLTKGLQRVVVDPNLVSRLHPKYSPVLLQDLKRLPTVGEKVIAAQPDDDGTPDFVGTATVMVVDRASGLAFLDVDWSSFRAESVPASVSANTRKQTYLHQLGGVLAAPNRSSNSTRRGRVKVA